MRLLAIDPGPTISAYVIMDEGKIVSKARIENTNDLLISGIQAWGPDQVIIEMPECFGMAVGKEILDTCRWVGRFEEAAKYNGHGVILVSRSDIKLHLCHSRRAKDTNIRQALLDRYGKEFCKGIVKDLWSALAVATFYLDTELKGVEKCVP